MANASSETTIHHIEHISALRGILQEQQQDVAELRAMMKRFESYKDVGMDLIGAKKYTEKVVEIQDAQNNRFRKLDEIIFHNRKELKSGETAYSTLLTYGKEVRKLEAGLRTLRLFTQDVIDMLVQNSTVMNRADDRIAYFEKRVATLEVEIQQWIEKLAP
ncbi:hypothetical protein AAGS61_18080 [Lysinibacillus sp. KU-BSD001]|uniref:hypothetical protein n=1 Tax=Lysinibacillus sp. KU-BSD001 TaxID=3141328 RepID=UPI0036EDD9FE